jgi:DNA-binding transcriptional LysR family regulator
MQSPDGQLPLDLLDLFVAVAETGSFSHAATKLGVTKGTISRGITKLESALGNELVHRTTRKVALSTAGQALLERVAPHLHALRQSVCSLPELEEQPSGVLKITAPTDFGIEVLPGLVAGFALRFPSVSIDAHVTNRVVDLGGEGFDLAIRAVSKPLRDSSMVAKPISPIGAAYYASPSYVARKGAPKVLHDPAHDWVMMRMSNLGPRARGSPIGRVNGDEFFFNREVIRAGIGVGLLPVYLGEPWVRRGELVRVLPGAKHRMSGRLVIMYPSARRLARKVSAFRDFVIDELAAHPLMA